MYSTHNFFTRTIFSIPLEHVLFYLLNIATMGVVHSGDRLDLHSYTVISTHDIHIGLGGFGGRRICKLALENSTHCYCGFRGGHIRGSIFLFRT